MGDQGPRPCHSCASSSYGKGEQFRSSQQCYARTESRTIRERLAGGRDVKVPTWNCSRMRVARTKYSPLYLVNRPTLIAAVMAVLPSRLGPAACASEIAVI